MHKSTIVAGALLVGLALWAGPICAQDAIDSPDDEFKTGGETAIHPDKGPTKADDARARELFMVGKTMYEGGRYASALELFEEAYQLSPRPMLLLSLASTYERLERNEDALRVLREYLPKAPKDKIATIDKRIANLEALRDEKAAEAERQAAAAREQVQKPEPEPVEESSLGLYGWITTGVGAAVGLGGGTLVLLGEMDHQEVVDDPQMLRDDAQVLVDSGDDKKMLGYIVAGAGGAILATGLVMVLLAPEGSETPNDSATVSAAFLPGPQGATLAFVGRF